MGLEMFCPIRILCVFGALDRGGAETMCMELYRHIDREKIQFDFVKHTSQKCAFDDEILSLGGRIYVAPKFLGWNLISYLKWWNRHLKAHQEHQVIHGHYFTISGLYFYVCKRKRRITIAHAHSTSISQNHKQVEKLLIKILNRYADYRLSCSKDAGRFLFPGYSFTVLKNAIDTDQFCFNQSTRERVRLLLGLSSRNHVIGTVGRLIPAKNPCGVIEIFKEIYQRDPTTIFLWVGDGVLHQEVEIEIRRYGLQEAVLMLGVRSDVNELLQAMDVFILPSLFEGLGIAAIEAQAAGLPCYCSDVIPSEVAITDLCHFLPLGKPKMWADEILGTSVERRDTKQEIISHGYDVRNTAKWLEAFYCNLNDT